MKKNKINIEKIKIGNVNNFFLVLGKKNIPFFPNSSNLTPKPKLMLPLEREIRIQSTSVLNYQQAKIAHIIIQKENAGLTNLKQNCLAFNKPKIPTHTNLNR